MCHELNERIAVFKFVLFYLFLKICPVHTYIVHIYIELNDEMHTYIYNNSTQKHHDYVSARKNKYGTGTVCIF